MNEAFQLLCSGNDGSEGDDPYASPFYLLSFDKQSEYIKKINACLDQYEHDIKEDLAQLFLHYIRMKKTHNWRNITESVGHTPLTSSELAHFQRLFDMIQNDPDIITHLQSKTGEQNLMEFFRVKPN